MVDPKDIELLRQIWQGAFSGDPQDKKSGRQRKSRGSSGAIDLHWEKLPYPPETPASQKLELQLRYLDEQVKPLAARGEKSIWVIHGHGEGALCEAVRNWARKHPMVAHFQTGGHPALGAAATKINLK